MKNKGATTAEEVPPVELGNKNKKGECGMCGVKVKKLTYQKVGKVEFMICENCKSIGERK